MNPGEAGAARSQVVVAATLPPGVTGAQFSSLVARCVELRLAELLGQGNYAVIAVTC